MTQSLGVLIERVFSFEYSDILILIILFTYSIAELPVLFLPLDVISGSECFMICELNALGYFLAILFWFIIGAIIGLIYGKIKNKPKHQF